MDLGRDVLGDGVGLMWSGRVDQLVLGVGLVLFLVDVPLLEDLYLLHLFFEEVLKASEAVGLLVVDADSVEGELGVMGD